MCNEGKDENTDENEHAFFCARTNPVFVIVLFLVLLLVIVLVLVLVFLFALIGVLVF